jgi:hypothetical protein
LGGGHVERDRTAQPTQLQEALPIRSWRHVPISAGTQSTRSEGGGSDSCRRRNGT